MHQIVIKNKRTLIQLIKTQLMILLQAAQLRLVGMGNVWRQRNWKDQLSFCP